MGRAAFVADELGSRLIAARLVRDVMRLALLIERQYAPYPKWFGTAFGALEAAAHLRPSLEGALAAADLESRERHLCAAYETVAGMHNALGVTAPLDTQRRRFFSRPFHIIGGERFASALLEAIEDGDLKQPRVIGGVDTLSDNTDFLEDVNLARDVFEIRRAD